MTSTCSVPNCSRPYLARGYCNMHYQRVRLYGSPGSAEQWDHKGAHNGRWVGGRRPGGHKQRYWRVYKPEHPYASAEGYVLEHRLVMESVIGRFLTPDELVHHLNHDPSDNRPENLAITTRSEHPRIHALERKRIAGRFA